MSQVRMCDRCGMVFPTNQAGWIGGQVTKVVRKDNGELTSVTEPIDQCAECTAMQATSKVYPLTAKAE